MGRTRGALRAAVGVALLLVSVPASQQAAASPTPLPPSLWVMNADGTDQRLLSDAVEWGVPAPEWSPDGSRIAYTTYEGVAVVEVSAPASTTVVPKGAGPSWSPDGSRIAFVLERPPATAALAVADADGSDVRTLSTVETYGGVEWSPDGSRIAFFACPGPRCELELRVVRADGTGESVLAQRGNGEPPSWSPDGESLAYAAMDGNVYAVDVGSGEIADLTPGDRTGRGPHWGPGGRIVYWETPAEGRPRVWSVARDGTGAMLLRNGAGAQWSPDGSRIAFRYGGAIWVHAPGTLGAANLTPGGRTDHSPRWSPDGRSIAYYGEDDWRPPPEHDRTISVVVTSRGAVRAVLETQGGGPRCVASLRLRLQRREEAAWVRVDLARTDAQGRATFPPPREPGAYRVRAPERDAGYPGDSPVCLEATSPRFRLRG